MANAFFAQISMHLYRVKAQVSIVNRLYPLLEFEAVSGDKAKVPEQLAGLKATAQELLTQIEHLEREIAGK